MSKLSKADRQEIVREFAVRHNGRFNPNLFLEEVRRKGSEHPAHGWFEWDRSKAALQWQIEQARDFARDLRVTFTVEEIGSSRKVTVRESAMPLVLSPVSGRRDGGGYVLVNPQDPTHMAEHVRQAAVALRAWWERYQAAVEHAGIEAGDVDDLIAKLEASGAAKPEAA